MKTLIASPNSSRLIAAAILGALALSCGATSIASENVYVDQRVVKFGDLNLSNSVGAATLYRRILIAARDVCGLSPSDFLQVQADARRCVHKSVAEAVTKVGHPQLIAVYNAKNREPLPVMVAKAPTR